jgi:putative transposase
MSYFVPHSPRRGSNSFRNISDVFFKQEGLPFSEVLPCEIVEDVFRKHNGLFGIGKIYSTAIVLWAFLGQVLQDGKMAACQAAVAGIIAHRQLLGQSAPTQDTGDYCRARAKLKESALRELSGIVAENCEAQADAKWLIKGRHGKLVDGFTFTMPDTDKNQRQYPQAKTQKPGIGFPIARCVAVVSLATACVMDLAIGPYAGKETGETALLRQLKQAFSPGDIAVVDRYYCSFMLLAAMLGKGVDVCCRKHHLRKSDFRRGKRLGKYDHLIVWQRPTQRPKWMDEETYNNMPEEIVLREIKFSISEPGLRTKSMTIITTLTNPDEFSAADIAKIYGFRWNVELDIRSIKSNLNLAHVRCQSPEMVRRELWITLLGYNLIRSTAASAAALHDLPPREISFTSTVQFVLQEWKQLSRGDLSEEILLGFFERMLKEIAKCRVGNRAGRIEPRVVKRRPKPYKAMMKPRHVLRAELRNSP